MTCTNLLSVQSGFARITQFDPSSYPSQLASEVKGFTVPDFVDPKEARRMSRFEHLALATTKEALERAGLCVTDEIADDVGVIIGTGVGSLTTSQNECKV